MGIGLEDEKINDFFALGHGLSIERMFELHARFTNLYFLCLLPRPSFIRLAHFFLAHLHILQSCTLNSYTELSSQKENCSRMALQKMRFVLTADKMIQ